MGIAGTVSETGPEILRCPAWKNYRWLVHGFSSRRGGTSIAYSPHADADPPQGELNLGFTPEDERLHVEQNRQRLLKSLAPAQPTAKLCTLRQVHSNRVLRIGGLPDAGLPEGESGDGMTTSEPGMLLAIQTADCVPILLVDPRQRAVAALHAGWRGTLQRIVEAGVTQMRSEFGSQPQDISAAIGPCIGVCCYEVGDEIEEAFAAHFPNTKDLFTTFEKTDQKAGVRSLHLDLVEANRQQLMASGLLFRSIHTLNECTSCHPKQFFSYRKSGGRTGRMMSVIGLTER